MILVEIAGFLGADPEERFTASGKRVISLRVATRVGRDETVWWKVNIWNDRFDKMLPYLKKGSAVIVVGDMSKPETYVAKDGANQVSLTLNAEMVKFSPFGRPGDKQTGQEQRQPYPQQSYSQQPSGDFGYGGSGSEEQYAGYGAGMDSGLTGDDLPF